jgi:hypothetical protein
MVLEAQHKAGQYRQCGAARLAQPAFDPHADHLGLILGLAPVEPMANQRLRLVTVWTAGRARKDNLCEMGNVILDRTAKILYDGHLFWEARSTGSAGKRTPVGRALPFLRMKRLAYPTLPCLPNPAHSLQRTVRGLAAPCTPAGVGPRTKPSQQLPKQKGRPKWTASPTPISPSDNYLSRNSPNCAQRNRPLTRSQAAIRSRVQRSLMDGSCNRVLKAATELGTMGISDAEGRRCIWPSIDIIGNKCQPQRSSNWTVSCG